MKCSKEKSLCKMTLQSKKRVQLFITKKNTIFIWNVKSYLQKTWKEGEILTNNAPVWAKNCEKVMIDRGMTKAQLSEEVKISPQIVSSVMTGYIYRPDVARRICELVGVQYE